MSSHVRILGVDPGSRITGFGLIDLSGSQFSMIDSGTIRCVQTTFAERLYYVYQRLTAIIEQYMPTEAAVEQVFTKINPGTALKLGQARGAILTALAQYQLPIAEYAPRVIKKSVVGYGAADKQQVQQMVRLLLSLRQAPSVDAADALAIAMCHANHRALASRSPSVVSQSKGARRL